jgi:dTDP-4-dehydrorhamnose reductase
MRVNDLLASAPGITHAFILFGETRIDECARDPSGTGRLNVDSTLQVVEDLAGRGIVPIFASSDAVFSGARGNYSEDDPPSPVLTYGRQKLAVEEHIARISEPSLILRIAKVIGLYRHQGDILDGWLRRAEVGQRIVCAEDQVLSPVAIDDVVTALELSAGRGLTGLYHLSGPQRVTRADLLKRLLHAAESRLVLRPVIEYCRLRDIAALEPRPLDCSMSGVRLARNLAMDFQQIDQICQTFVAARMAEPSAQSGKVD